MRMCRLGVCDIEFPHRVPHGVVRFEQRPVDGHHRRLIAVEVQRFTRTLVRRGFRRGQHFLRSELREGIHGGFVVRVLPVLSRQPNEDDLGHLSPKCGLVAANTPRLVHERV